VTRSISIDNIRDAAGVIYETAVRTPLVRADLGGSADLYLKLETLQPVGSFKIRGAYNAVRRLSPAERAQGVWTVSAGNAAQGLALAANRVGAPCSVLVFDTAPATKLQAIERFGARIVKASHDECWRTVESGRSDRMNGRFVHPFDDDDFIAGNGTIGLEIFEDLPDVDVVIAAIGGGGLIAGIASALRTVRPRVKIFAAEPETAAPLAASIAAGHATAAPHWQPSFVDGAGGQSVLPSMWPLLSTLVDGAIVVSLDEIRCAMRLVAERAHVICEGAAACAVAAALTGRAASGRTVAIVSGGNIDLPHFAALVEACGAQSPERRA
jgi:threonine dehydratase